MAEAEDKKRKKRKASGTAEQELKGVRRYRKGRTLCETIFGRTRYGKDLVTDEWVIIKESKRWNVQNRISIRNLHVAEDLGQEIAMHEDLMKCPNCSPNIVKLLDVCEDPTYIYVITEFCRGGDLFNFVHSSHPLYKEKTLSKASKSPENSPGCKMEIESNASDMEIEASTPGNEKKLWNQIVRGLFRQLAQCISWMHSERFCHRDLSLENILLTADGLVKVIDFGVCKRYKSANETFRTKGGFIGKTGYCAPEVYNLKEYDGRKADIWSMGVILFVLLTGAPPYQFPLNSDAGFRIIYGGGIEKLLTAWKRPVPSNAQDLLTRIFRPERQRITSEELMQHPYMISSPPPDDEPKVSIETPEAKRDEEFI